MDEKATTHIKSIDTEHLPIFATRLTEWLIDDLNQGSDSVPDFTESRAKALLRAADAVDAPTLDDFARLMDSETTVSADTAVRLALFDLLQESELATSDQLPITSNQSPVSNPQSPVSWLALSIAAFAWKSGYPLHQLDPAAPPNAYSPAGQVVKRAAHWLRQQVQRSATDRDKLGRKLAYEAGTASDGVAAPTLDNLHPEGTIAPVPPHFRPPVPVRYPEVARETVRIEPDENPPEQPARSTPITITNEDLEPPASQPTRMPSIRIDHSQIPPARPRVIQPQPSTSPANFAQDVRRKFNRSREPLTTTKLRIIVQEYPDGPGLYGLQVRVRCKGINSHVAGTTGRDGRFLCELPVRAQTGLTYDVDITWPPDLGGKTERKSITLNADRTEFTLPFFQKQQA